MTQKSDDEVVLSADGARHLLTAVLDNARSDFRRLHRRIEKSADLLSSIRASNGVKTRNQLRRIMRLQREVQEWRELKKWFLGKAATTYCHLVGLSVENVRRSVYSAMNLTWNSRHLAEFLDKVIFEGTLLLGPEAVDASTGEDEGDEGDDAE